MKAESNRQKFVAIFFLACIVTASAGCQQAAPTTVPTPGIPSTGFKGLDEYRANRIAVFTDDFGQLARYREANEKLGTPAAGENRVIFSETRLLTSGIWINISLASLTSIVALEGRPHHRC